jgi:hypothetical protein
MRYELTDFEWAAIWSFLPNKPRGIPRVDDRAPCNCIFLQVPLVRLKGGNGGPQCVTQLSLQTALRYPLDQTVLPSSVCREPGISTRAGSCIEG